MFLECLSCLKLNLFMMRLKMWQQWRVESWFVTSNGWLMKFMKWNNLSMRKQTTTTQKDPSHLMTKLVKYVMHVWRLPKKTKFSLDFAMDKTTILVWRGWECDSWYHWDRRCTSQINQKWKGQSEHMLNHKSRWDKTKTFYCLS